MMIRLLLILIIITAITAPAAAQIVGHSLERSQFDIGVAYKYYHRDLEPIRPAESKWEVATIFARYGALGRATLLLEGGIWDLEHDDFPDQYFNRFTAGLGASVFIWSWNEFKLNASIHYSELFDHDTSKNHFHKKTRNVTGALFVEHSIPVMEQSLELWGGLIYSFDDGETYPWGVPPTIAGESENNIGLGLGAGALLLEHLRPFVQIVYVEYFQPRLGVSFQP